MLKSFAGWIFKRKINLGLQVRYWVLCNLLKSLGKGVHVFAFPALTYPERIEIGDDSTLNPGVVLGGRGGIRIGKRVRLSNGVILETAYLHKEANGRGEHLSKPIRIEDNVWIASGAIVLAGVTIGRNSIVAAGAVVTQDVPENSMAKGIPAQSRALQEGSDSP